MELNEVIFIDSFPKIDLHGYDRETARVAINDFIKERIKLKNDIVVIIHGKGSGILRTTTNETLKRNKKVIEFKTYYNNPGATIVKIEVEKWK